MKVGELPATRGVRRAYVRGIVLRWVVGTGIALSLFDFIGPFFAYARRGFVSSVVKSHPPIFASLHPRAFIGLPFAIALAVAGFFGVRRTMRGGISNRVLVAGAALYLFFFSVAVAFIQGRSLAVWGVRSYIDRYDALRAKALGVREFVKAFPDIAPTLRSIHAVTHPPGRTLAALAVHEISATSLVMRALCLAGFASLIVVPAWFLARKLIGERGARVAVCLLAAVPSVVMMGFVSYEAIEAVIFTSVIAAFVWGGFWDAHERLPLVFAGGFLLGLAAFLTYAIVFIAAFTVLLAFMRRPWRAAVRLLLVAAAGGIAALAVLRVAAGYDLLASFRATHDGLVQFLVLNPRTPGFDARPYAYWLFGNPAAWLTFAGLPVAALALRELLTRRPPYLLAMVVPVGAFYVIPATITHIIPGEVERTIQYALPLAVIAAAASLQRDTIDDRAVPVFVAIALAQTILLQILFFTFW